MIWLLLGFALFGVIVLVLLGWLTHHVPRPMHKSFFEKRWHKVLESVKTPEGMVLAVINADKLVDEALRRRGFHGKTMGERLVSAQRSLSDNDSVWFAHKLRNKLVHESDHPQLNASTTKRALAGFKQALKDLRAL